MKTVYLGLGTNVGETVQNLRRAVRSLQRIVEIDEVSSVHRTEPVGYTDQPHFLNMVLRVRTELEPSTLLAETQRIERELGRERSFPNAPRIIDIDILLYGDCQISTPELTVPHPRMLERGFVLRPLVELDSELRHPVADATVGALLTEREPLETGERLFPGERLLEPDTVDESQDEEAV